MNVGAGLVVVVAAAGAWQIVEKDEIKASVVRFVHICFVNS